MYLFYCCILQKKLMLFSKPKYICKAAECSLLFQPGGEVLSCHYNRGYILGNYPNSKISEIWDSKKRRNLVSLIRSGKFDPSCYNCKSAIESGYLNKAGIHKYDYIIPGKHKMPVSMEFQLDNKCNLECIMCSGEYSSQIRENREQGSPYISPYDSNFTEELNEFIPYLNQASFTGGEPFLFDIYYKIWDNIKLLNPGLQLYISSNGTVLNDKVKSYLDDLNFNLTISIDSLVKSHYEKIRKNAVLENTLQNIDYFINYCKKRGLNFNIKSLVTPQNYMDIPELLAFCNERKVNFIPKTVLIPSFASFSSIDLEEIKSAISLISNTIDYSDTQITKQNKNRLNEIALELKTIIQKIENADYDYINLNLDELKGRFLQNLIKNNEAKKSFYADKLELLYSYSVNDSELRASIISFINIPSDVLISEFNRTDIRKLGERFKQSGKSVII